MKKLTLLFLVLTLSCSQSKPTQKAESAAAEPPSSAPAAPAPAPAAAEISATAQGEPYALHIDSGVLTFCDQRGMRKLDLKTGQDTASSQPCPKAEEANTACTGLGLDVSVRSPQGEPNDIVDVDGSSVPLKGKVHDCAADGKVLAVSTASAVSVIDVATGTSTEVSKQGGDRVAIGSGWVAWADGSKVRAAPRNAPK
ncbi:MAG TPA: hypothetical protein VGH38_24990 [Bryobacteraceae bacterium]